MSYPQACITGVELTTTLLAYGRLVFSAIGRASSSVRNITVGPSPFFITAATPVRPNTAKRGYVNRRKTGDGRVPVNATEVACPVISWTLQQTGSRAPRTSRVPKNICLISAAP